VNEGFVTTGLPTATGGIAYDEPSESFVGHRSHITWDGSVKPSVGGVDRDGY
jgi:hypothetical protein